MNDKTIRVGLVGAGSIAQVAELPALSVEPGVRIAGVVTTHPPEEVKKKLDRWPIEQYFSTVEEMIEKACLDALFVLTPKQFHFSYVKLGLLNGLDVFCEKPLTTSLAESQELADLAEKTGRVLMVGFNRRFAEVYQTAHAQFQTKEVRFCIAQKNRPGSEYRATLENSIHMVDLLRWFCGEAEDVVASTIAPDPYYEEGTAAHIQFSSGAVGVLMAARCAGEWDERLDVYGNLTSVRVVAPDMVSISRSGETRTIEMRPRAMGWAQVLQTMGFGPEVSHFIECIRTRKQPLTNGKDAVKTQALMDQILRKAGLPLSEKINTI